MSWTRFLFAILAAGIVSCFTDWFFSGILFHAKYNAYPEVWRESVGQRDTRAITGSVALGFVTSAAFVATCVVFRLHGYDQTLSLAGLAWLIVPVPLLVTNALFIKLHPLTVVSHSLGWLAKLAVAALSTAFFLA